MKEPRYESMLSKIDVPENYLAWSRDDLLLFIHKESVKAQKTHQAKRDAWILREFKKKFNVWANSDFKSIPARWKAFDNMWEELKKLLKNGKQSEFKEKTG